MKIKKRKVLLIITIFIIVSIAGVSALNSRNTIDKNDILKAADTIKKNLQEKADKIEIATANGISIYQDEVELNKDLYMITEKKNEKEAYREAILGLARNRVLYRMAEDMGLALTIEQALGASLQERDVVYTDEKVLEDNNKYIAALGLTEDQYWTEYHVIQKQLYLSIEKLKTYYTNEAVKENKLPKIEFHTKETSQQYNEYLKQVIKQIEDSIVIDIKDPKYKEILNQ